MSEFGLDTKIAGRRINEYLAELARKNDELLIEIERGKLGVLIAKQMNNNSRLQLEAAKYELKKREFESKQIGSA
jgi:predicted transglutaminase-like protease